MKTDDKRRRKVVKNIIRDRKRYMKGMLRRSKREVYSRAPQIAAVEYLCIVLTDRVSVMTEHELDAILNRKHILRVFYDSWRAYEDTIAQNMETVVLRTIDGLITDDGRDSNEQTCVDKEH